jgi:hypothetical protein
MDHVVKKCYDLLIHEISDVNTKWKIYKQIYYSSEENLELLNEFAPICFKYFQRVLIDDILISICKLTDPPQTGCNNNLSLLKLIKLIDADSDLNSDSMVIYIKIEYFSNVVKDHRNKRIGHNDYDLKAFGVKKLKNIPYATIDEILDLITSFINGISKHYENMIWSFDVILSEGGDVLMYHLKRLHEFYKEKELMDRKHYLGE